MTNQTDIEEIYHIPTLEKELIIKALTKFKGNKHKAYTAMGVPRNWLDRKMNEHGIHQGFGKTPKSYTPKSMDNKYGI